MWGLWRICHLVFCQLNKEEEKGLNFYFKGRKKIPCSNTNYNDLFNSIVNQSSVESLDLQKDFQSIAKENDIYDILLFEKKDDYLQVCDLYNNLNK